MAYMNQERKANIAAKLKALNLKGWKYSLRVRHHSTIVMTVQSAPVDVIGIANETNAKHDRDRNVVTCRYGTHMDVNPYHSEKQFTADPSLVKTVSDILACLNDGNWDKSDIMTDYFNVGWYVEINFGTWDKPYVNTKA